MRHRFLRKACVLFAAVFVLCQSFMLPMALANGSWTGTSWTGNSWSGERWEGSAWTGDTWEGSAWTKDGWQGNGSDSNSGGSNIIPENSNEAGGGSGLIPSGSGTLKPLPPYVSNPYLPLIPSNNGDKDGTIQGALLNESVIPSNISKEQKDEDQGIDPWDIASYLGNDVINGQVDFAVSILEQGDNVNLKGTFGGPNFFSTLILNGAKLPLGERTPPWFDLLEDVHNGSGMALDIYNGYADINRTAFSAITTVNDGMEVLPTVMNGAASYGMLTKFNIATSAVSTGFSLVNTVQSAGDTWKVIDSNAATSEKVEAGAMTASDFGELVFNAGMLTAAFPGAQAVGLGIAAVGGAIWLAGKGVKWAAKNWSSISGSKVGRAAKEVWKGVTKPFKWLTGS